MIVITIIILILIRIYNIIKRKLKKNNLPPINNKLVK